MAMPPDLAERYDDALAAARAVLHRVGTPDLPRPTPCRGWNLRTLTEHMIGQNEGFATAIAGGDADVTAYTPRPVGDQAGLMQAWDESVGHLQAAVDAADPHQPVRLVEIARDTTFPAAAAVGMHLLDTVVHSWDVATALGERYRPEQVLIDLVADGSLQVPAGDARTRPDAAFAPSIEATSTDPWTVSLARLGRRWTA